MKIKSLCALAGIAASILALSTANARTWTQSASGKAIEADYVGVEGTNVQLSFKGQTVSVPIGSLSAEDQAFIKEQMASAAAGGGGGTDWPRFRGPNQDDISSDTDLLKEWPESGPKKLWTFENAGAGYAGFAVSGGKLYTIGSRGQDLTLIALDVESGEEIWATTIGSDDENGYNAGWGGGPRSSPTVANGKVYALGPKGTLACCDAESGDKVWDKNIQSEFSGTGGGWGYSESPLVDNGLVIVAPGGSSDSLVALDAETGAKKWGSDIPGVGKAEYATVLATEIGGVKQYVKFYDKVIAGVNPENGSVLWTGSFPKGATAAIPTPIIKDNRIFVTAGYGAGCKMFEIDGDTANDVWENGNMGVHHGGAVLIGDHVYGLNNSSMVCLDWETGNVAWEERGPGKGAITFADGMFYCVGEARGMVHLVEATPDGYKEASQFTLDPQDPERPGQGKVWTHPVVIGGKLFLRDWRYITAYDVKG
ncbi:MAG: outer membrane protein assembly factor BamB [Verrucomicrobiales bacterium]|jgi:outer membrane protein assembly factor BamB